MDFVLSFPSLPPSHALAATSIAFLSHASCQIILPPLPPAPQRALSVAPQNLWHTGASEGTGAAGEPWPFRMLILERCCCVTAAHRQGKRVPACGGGFCWSQTRALGAHRLQTWQPWSVGAPSLQITKQFGARPRSHLFS